MIRNALAAALLLSATLAEGACRQALTLGLDVSGSVDAQEYRLQLDGLAYALRTAEVQEALLQFPSAPVRLMIFEWSGPDHQRVITDWQTISRASQLEDIVAQLRQTAKATVPDDSTAIVAAMRFAHRELMAQDCWQRSFDISGDGAANVGRHPRDLPEDVFDGITVNALVIGPLGRANTDKDLSDVKTLERYFSEFVIRGAGAFVETAATHADFADAMARKLVREIDAPALSRRGPALSVQ